MNVLLVFTILVIIAVSLLYLKNKENFYPYRGQYRGAVYQNLCEPDYGGILRYKREPQDGCLRTLEGSPFPQARCYYDRFMRKWCDY